MDAPSGPICGDGVCAPSEADTCPADCGSGSGSAGPCNDDGFCEPDMGETNVGCPSDCDYVCGNGLCESGETETSCPADCGTRPFDCTDVFSQDACYACFKDDAEYGVGQCDDDSDVSGGTADDCAACVGSGVFGSGCESACASGESDACAQCVAFSQSCGDGACQQYFGETPDNCAIDCTFDCGSAATQDACQTCLGDDYTGGSGYCDSNGEAYPGSAADCAACVGSGFGSAASACAAYCGSGDTADCAQCVSAQQYCGDGTCDYEYYGENHEFCPTDCDGVCGDGVCQTAQGETTANCPDDCFVDCGASTTVLQCYSCFEEDFEYGSGYCDELTVDAPLTPDGCATCVATGGFDSGSACGSACSSGETDACAHCMHNLAGNTFDCSNPYSLGACQTCFADEQNDGSGACDAFFDAYPGSAADCFACVGSGAFGSACEALCGSGATDECLTCGQIAQDCGDDYCDTFEGEDPIICPVDCPAVCGDGVCDLDNGESPTECGSDCHPPANETCDTATALTVNTPMDGTTALAVSDYDPGYGGCTTYADEGPDVAYSVVLTAGTAYTITVTASDWDVAVALVGPGDPSVCDPAETGCVAGADDSFDIETFDYTPATTGTYYIIVDGYDESGPFTVEVDD